MELGIKGYQHGTRLESISVQGFEEIFTGEFGKSLDKTSHVFQRQEFQNLVCSWRSKLNQGI